MPLVKDKAILVPTAHDEPPIYLSIFESLFSLPRALIFLTDEERNFVNLKFKTDCITQDIIGTGIDCPETIDPSAFKQKYGLKNFIVYVGRIDESKGCRKLFDYFIRYKLECPGSLKLVLLGKNVMELPKHSDFFPLGFVSEQDKFDCIIASDLLVMPSMFESLSIVLFEAWHCNRPVLVNGNCDVLKGQCQRSNAGLWYENYGMFKESLNLLLNNNRLRNTLGMNGFNFVRTNYSWDLIEEKYQKMLKKLT